MIAFDTNLLVRLFVADEPAQVETAENLLVRAGDENEPVFISLIVVVETAWTLRSRYAASRRELLGFVRGLIDEPRFEIERLPLVEAALARFERGRGDFADYLIGEVASAEGARTTMTFDRALRREPGFTLL